VRLNSETALALFDWGGGEGILPSHFNHKLIFSLYVCMAMKHIMVLFVETPRKN
jgi:hypothetical protein